MSSRLASADPHVRTAAMSLIAVAVVLGTAACRWFSLPECPAPFGDYFPPEKVLDAVRGHAGPVWGRAGGSDVIVFGWDEGQPDGGSLYMVRADGTGLTLLSPSIGDGRELGCFDHIDADGTGDYRVAFDTSPAVSPDGRTIAYHTLRQSIFASSPDIVKVALDGGELEHVTRVREAWGDTEPAWSPDGKRIAFLKNGRLHTMAADGSEVVRIARNIRAAPQPPAWSPDGALIAFRGKVRGNPWSLYVVGADGSNLTAVASSLPTEIWSVTRARPVWSPDGRHIAYVGIAEYPDERPRAELFLLDIKTGESWSLQLAGVHDYTWSHDGVELLYASEMRSTDHETISLTGVFAIGVRGDLEIRELFTPSGGAFFAGIALSPDGRQLAVLQASGGDYVLLLTVSTDGSEVRELVRVRGATTLVAAGEAQP